MILARFIMFGALCFNAGHGDARASVSVAAVWAIVEAAVHSDRIQKRRRRSWRREPRMVDPTEWPRD